MFDIGFAELLIIGIVGLLVIGPERLPSAIRTASLYIGRIRRGFNDIKREVQQELHNDSVMQDLKETGERLKEDTEGISKDLKESADAIKEKVAEQTAPTEAEKSSPKTSTE